MDAERPDLRREQVAGFDLRGIHPGLHFGTASDRYAGWSGQIYPEERWGDSTRSRVKRLGGKTFEERQVPVESVSDYFTHFSVLELDFTFYRPLLEPDGGSGSNYFVLRQYAEAAPDHARFIIKAPQAVSARILRRGSGHAANESYLDREVFQNRFLDPATELLGNRLAGVLFEQEYNRVSGSPEPEAFAEELEAFFDELPPSPQVHLEIRSTHLLEPPYFEMLRRQGLGFCFSHWTYLPSIKGQWQAAGGTAEAALTAADGNVVLRLLTPRGVPYADAYAQAYPFDRTVPEIADTPEGLRMIDESTALVIHALESDRQVNVIANNRAWGNAPELARTVALRFLDFAPQRGL